MQIKPLTQRLLAVKTELSRQGISKGKQAPAAMGSFKFRGIEATMNIISKLHSENGVLVRVAHILDKDTQKDGKWSERKLASATSFIAVMIKLTPLKHGALLKVGTQEIKLLVR